jgi:ParB family transcriptional regulator, chromosome partitioning protein
MKRSANLRRVFAKPVPLSKAERKRLHKLQTRYDVLVEKHQHDDEVSPKAAEQLTHIEGAIEALHREEYKVRDIALASAFVTLAGDGSVRIERGLVRADDEPKPLEALLGSNLTTSTRSAS